ncbi:MAG: threonyl-tRNA synthetase editing domain-containing protein [Candidatus Altiarchaeota archaeon]
MRLLFIHADEISYEVGKRTAVSEDIPESEKEDSMRDCLVAFSCVENFDERQPDETVKTMASEILKTLEAIKAKNVMIFPFAHLSQSISSPEVALMILNKVVQRLRDAGLNVKKVPFGWYKKFKLESKGHPMAVSSKTICPMMKECSLRCPHCDWPIPIKNGGHVL